MEAFKFTTPFYNINELIKVIQHWKMRSQPLFGLDKDMRIEERILVGVSTVVHQ